MAVYNRFLSKCEVFQSSFAEDPALARVATLLVHPLRTPVVGLPYRHAAHPFQRFAAEELELSDSVDRLATDLNACLAQEGLAPLHESFFGVDGVYRDRVIALLRWFWLYADATTGLGEFDENEWN